MRGKQPTRRKYLLMAGAVGSAGIAGCNSQQTEDVQAASDGDTPASKIGGSPQFGYNSANTGHAATETGPTDSITEAWSFETGGYVDSSPAVADGTIYFGSEDTNIYAIDAVDGSEQWTFETDDLVVSSPAVVDNTVYIGSDDGNTYVLTEQ